MFETVCVTTTDEHSLSQLQVQCKYCMYHSLQPFSANTDLEQCQWHLAQVPRELGLLGEKPVAF